MKLVIVETPAQANVLTGALGDGWRVEPCHGLVRDLVDGALGIDPAADFHPTFAVATGKGNLVRCLMKALRDSEAVYAATPPGRAGELMAWHVLALLPEAKDKPIYRVSLSSLTGEAIRSAFAAPRPLNMHWIDAELALRLVDRLAGYTINTAARERGDHQPLSRTAMVALCRLTAQQTAPAPALVERWQVMVRLNVDGIAIKTALHHADGGRLHFTAQDKAEAAAAGLRAAQYWVTKVGLRERELPAPAPYTLASLLLDAERRLRIAPGDTLRLIDTLVDAGWITHPLEPYPPTLVEAARRYLRREYGTDYAVNAPVELGNGIAPADVSRPPEDLPGDGAALYGLIWQRFMAALLPPVMLRQSGVLIGAGANRARPYPLSLQSVGTLVAFDGWLRVLPGEQPPMEGYLPAVREGDTALFVGAEVERLSPPAPKRLTAAALIAEHGGARPADWAAALESLETAGYIQREDDNVLALTEGGISLAAWLNERFPSVVSESAVARLDLDLERMAVGERGRVDVVRAFWERLTADARLTAPPQSGRPAGAHKPVVLRPAAEV
ncbi:MAG: DNA topoisomerase [Anaerolinea sp.]|nr:DNA topoisomerase [Anaerolinea sp.]